MRTPIIIVLICLLLHAFLFSGCTRHTTEIVTNSTAKENEIIQALDYNSSACVSTGYSYANNGTNIGFRIVLKDADTGNDLNGSVDLTLNSTSSGFSTGQEGYTCQEGVFPHFTIISVYSPGHAPKTIDFQFPSGKLITVQIPMHKSCTQGLSCIDNIKKAFASKLMQETYGYNSSVLDEMLKSEDELVSQMIYEQFGMNKTDYKLSCLECNQGRGGFIKAAGLYKNDTPFDLYYHYGWCSSGGSDCGSSICFSVDKAGLADLVYDSLKNKTCSTLQSNRLHDDYSCTMEGFDNTTEARQDCFAGAYEQISGQEKSFAISKVINRCSSSAESINFNCLEN